MLCLLRKLSLILIIKIFADIDNADIHMSTVNMGGSERKLKCLSILEKVEVIQAVDAKLKSKQVIKKEFDIPNYCLQF